MAHYLANKIISSVNVLVIIQESSLTHRKLAFSKKTYMRSPGLSSPKIVKKFKNQVLLKGNLISVVQK